MHLFFFATERLHYISRHIARCDSVRLRDFSNYPRIEGRVHFPRYSSRYLPHARVALGDERTDGREFRNGKLARHDMCERSARVVLKLLISGIAVAFNNERVYALRYSCVGVSSVVQHNAQPPRISLHHVFFSLSDEYTENRWSARSLNRAKRTRPHAL